MTWWDYVERHTKHLKTHSAIGELAGVDQSQVGRWRAGQVPKASTVVQLARGLGREPLEALVAAGYLTPAEANASVTHVEHVDLTDVQLLEEVGRRMARGSATAAVQWTSAATGHAPPVKSGVDLAAMAGTPDHMPDEVTGEESQDPGHDDPA